MRIIGDDSTSYVEPEEIILDPVDKPDNLIESYDWLKIEDLVVKTPFIEPIPIIEEPILVETIQDNLIVSQEEEDVVTKTALLDWLKGTKIQEVLEDVGEFIETAKGTKYYSQFTPRELAYIVNFGEITEDFAREVIVYKGKQEKLSLPLQLLLKYKQYASKDTSFSSEGIIVIPETYADYTMEDFAHLNSKDEPFWRHDRCIYIMKKLSIYDYGEWGSLTGYKGKGSRFMDEVGKNVGGLIGGVTKFVGNMLGDVLGGFAEGILGKDWQMKLAIVIIIIIILVVLIGIGYFYLKSYVGQKAIKKVGV